MRKFMLRMTLAYTFLGTATLAEAQVQHIPFRVNVPFEFVAADRVFPPGEYTVSAVSPDWELISGKSGRAVTFAPATLKGQPGKTNLLIFHQVGDKMYLAEVWPSGSKTGRMVGGVSLEKKLNESMVAREVTVISGTTR